MHAASRLVAITAARSFGKFHKPEDIVEASPQGISEVGASPIYPRIPTIGGAKVGK